MCVIIDLKTQYYPKDLKDLILFERPKDLMLSQKT